MSFNSHQDTAARHECALAQTRWALVAAACILAGAVLHSAATPSATTRRSASIAGYSDGAPAGFSGGFTEQSCHACHFHADINTGPGKVALTGAPVGFVAGERYVLAITLTRTGMALGGFQLTARFKDGGAQAGTLSAPRGEEERVTIQAQTGVQYASQRRAGTALVAPDTARWIVEWTAPDTGGTVVFNVAANAADKDESAEGDYVYTTMAQSEPAAGRALRR
jgi:hypothetical protein